NLKSSGGTITLMDSNSVIVDQVRYSGGGRWGNWSGGGGSSLELLDPRSDHRVAGNWADSNESGKTTNWTVVEYTNYLDNGHVQQATTTNGSYFFTNADA